MHEWGYYHMLDNGTRHSYGRVYLPIIFATRLLVMLITARLFESYAHIASAQKSGDALKRVNNRHRWQYRGKNERDFI